MTFVPRRRRWKTCWRARRSFGSCRDRAARAAIEAEYERRYEEALEARIAAYTKPSTSWRRRRLGRNRRGPAAEDSPRPSSEEGATDKERLPIPQLRSELDACDARLREAVAELHRIIDGERVATVSLGSYFAGGIETEEQLDAALDGIREECSRLIGAGKKVIVQ